MPQTSASRSETLSSLRRQGSIFSSNPRTPAQSALPLPLPSSPLNLALKSAPKYGIITFAKDTPNAKGKRPVKNRFQQPLPTALLTLITLSLFLPLIHAQTIPNAYIVQITETADLPALTEKLTRLTGGKIGHRYHKSFRGFSIRVPPGILRAHLLAHAGVLRIEPDLQVEICTQTLPTYVDRIDLDLHNTAKIDGLDEPIDVDIAVIDTGIDINHPDLNVVGGTRTVAGNPADYDDDNGHGTEVAGVIAALDNNLGIVGAAPGARLWSIKSFDSNRSGTGADILAGIEWVAERTGTIEILNMSWRGWHQAPLHRTAVQNCVAGGVVCFSAAGNDARDIYGPDNTFGTNDDTWPAYFPEVAAVSALADTDGRPGGLGPNTNYGNYPDDSFAAFSSYSQTVHPSHPVTSPGRAIDLLMPGVDIYTTFLNGAYAYDSGTSLAAPLAAGLAALYIADHGRAYYPTQVYAIRQALIDSAATQTGPRGLDYLNDPDGRPENIGYYTPGDLDHNGTVNLQDYAILAAAYLTAPPDPNYCPTCDIAQPLNNSIDHQDLQTLSQNWLIPP